MRKPLDYSNRKIGKLEVIERAEDVVNCYGSPVIVWKCRCECGDIVYRRSSHLKRGSCRCKKCKALEESKRFGFKDIRQCHWSSIQHQAVKRGIEFSVSVEYAWQKYLDQNRQCALSGIPIVFASTKEGHLTGETTASLDRIDSTKGYVEDNVQWLHKWVNLMKSDFTQSEFVNFCRKIVLFQEVKNETASCNEDSRREILSL